MVSRQEEARKVNHAASEIAEALATTLTDVRLKLQSKYALDAQLLYLAISKAAATLAATSAAEREPDSPQVEAFEMNQKIERTVLDVMYESMNNGHRSHLLPIWARIERQIADALTVEAPDDEILLRASSLLAEQASVGR